MIHRASHTMVMRCDTVEVGSWVMMVSSSEFAMGVVGILSMVVT
jgi:hypothetical protein